MIKRILQNENMLNVVALILFTILFCAAFLLFHERLYLDSNYYIFKLINERHFIIEHQRPTLIFGQVLPLLGVWAHLSLKTVLILASVNHILFSFLAFCYCVYYLKDTYAGWALLLSLVCGTYFLFYFVTLEGFYGAQLLVVFYAFLRQMHFKKISHYIIAITLWLFVVLAHPTLIICGGFILLYYILSKAPNFSIRFIVILFIITAIVFVAKSLHVDAYESQKLSYEFNFKQNGFYKQLYTVLFWKNLFKLWMVYYAEILYMVLATTIFLFVKRKYASAALIFFFFVGFILLANITSLGCNIRSDYCEHTIIGIVPASIIPFMYSVFPACSLRMRNIVCILFLFIIIFRVTETLNHAEDFRKRIRLFSSWVNECQSMPGHRFYITKSLAEKEDEKIEWTLPIETLYISKMEHNTSKSIITEFVWERDKQLGILNADVFHYGYEKVINIKDLNPYYFTIEKGDYIKLEPLN